MSKTSVLLYKTGMWLGCLLAMGPLYVAVAGVLLLNDPAIPPESAAAAQKLTHQVKVTMALSTLGLSMTLTGAGLIVLCLSALLRNRNPSIPPTAEDAARNLAKRRSSAWATDVILIPFLSTQLFQLIGGADQQQSSAIAGFCFALCYLLFKDGVGGRSIGKMLNGLITLGPDGAPCTLLQSFKRNLPLLLPVVPWIAAGQIWGFQTTRVGDAWAGSHVEILETAEPAATEN